MNIELNPPEQFGDDEKSAFVQKWIDEFRKAHLNDGYIPDTAMWFAFSPHLRPMLCWDLIKRIYFVCPDELLGYLGAGPLESLLASSGDDLIDQVETFSRENQRFQRVLQAVWRNAITDEVWSRICGLREC